MKLLILVIFLIVEHVLPYKFPEKFDRCHRDDPDLDNCLLSTIHNALNLMGAEGISSLNLPSIDPLEITSVEIGAGTSAVHLVQKYFDAKLLGLSSASLEKAHLDLDKKELIYDMHLPKLELEARYEVDGNIMMMPVFGKGDCLISLYDVTIEHVLNFEEETKNGKQYFRVKSYKISVNPNGAHYHFANLFNGDQQLADNILKVLNDNWKDIFDDVKEGLERTFSEVFKLVANRLFEYVPAEEIFLI